ncbi:flagellar FlbD family protein [Clostridium sp.]|uniref:flagellar FlbD family protein n=1 Tax=Clostridium sp. TaxID=1506 RepID=UPI0034648B12
MITVRAMTGKDFILNCDHIEKIESVPETLITLTNGKKYIVMETPNEVIKRAIEYKNKMFYFKGQGAE